jgi:hypothetical protein
MSDAGTSNADAGDATNNEPRVQRREKRPRDASVLIMWGALGVLVVVAVVALVVLVTRSSGPYSRGDQDAFLAACTRDGGEPVRPACVCLWNQLVENVSYERFVEVNDLLRAQPNSSLPADIDAYRNSCVEQLSGGAGPAGDSRGGASTSSTVSIPRPSGPRPSVGEPAEL